MKRVARGLGLVFLWLLCALWLLWCAGTLLWSNLTSEPLRQVLAGGFLALVVLAPLLVRPRRRGRFGALGAGAVATLAYLLTFPSNDRDWQPEVAVAARTELEGSRLTVRGVRNFRWRSEEDYDVAWEDRTYDLDAVRTLDLAMSYWGPRAYCHTILSFGFEGGEELAVSVEVRKEVGEGYSTYGGLFRRFELSYVFADERDVLGVRTNVRGEEVYLYRLRARPERVRELLVAYARFADRLAREPEFYGVLRNSCGVNILHRVAETGARTWVGRDALLNGYWDELLYAKGAIHQGLPFEELRAASRIDERARDAGLGPDFSARIREGLPPAPESTD